MFTEGFIGKNKQGLTYEVLDAKKSKQIRIRFEDGVELVTTKRYLSNGLPLHPTKFKMLPGDIHKDRDSVEFELIEKVGGGTWKIRYLKGGVECTRETSTIKECGGRHPIDSVPAVGDTYEVTSGIVKIIKYKSATDVTVEFEDGSVVKTTASCLRHKNVGHPTSGIKVGQKRTTNSGWEYTIEKYVSPTEVYVRMQDGSIEKISARDAKTGGFKPCNQPSVSGVGFIGKGRFTNLLKKEGEKAPEEIYSYWHRMIGRCYNPAEIIKNSGRRYIFVNIHKDWFNFQNFAEWALSQPNWNMGHDLDKDLLGNGIEYSPENCTFLPSEINVFLAENWSKTTHDLPIGVQYIKPATAGAKEGYVARCHTDNGREYLGYFDDPMDAHIAYKNTKEAYAKVLAEKFKDVITKQAYEALKNFKLTKVYSEPPHVCGKN